MATSIRISKQACYPSAATWRQGFALLGRSQVGLLGYRQLCFVVSDFGLPFVVRHDGINFHIYQPVFQVGRNVSPQLCKCFWFLVLFIDQRDLDPPWQIPLIAVTPRTLCSQRFWRC